ncbi:microtubule-associated protein futsch [Cataglyphis hispanica]|uniref:microtubule-associated protein futsch n=1 Tax=Cataglyphis hispanica TaxID=1086592 RepID=UPI00218000EE|nr:microtubule-associated protein futsch [Cataglyphis hispanica]
MSTTDPTGEGGGGGGGGGEGAMSTNVEQNASPSTPNTGAAVPVQATAQQQQQHPPPSPLSGCYLLVVLPEPHTAQHKDLILNRLAKGFLSWDKDSCHVDLEKELLALVAQAPEGEEARNGERLIQYATENLVTEVLIHPQTNTLLQCIRNLLASFTKHRHIIHAGYTFGGNGSWILQDGTFSLADFLDAFSEHEVQRVLRAYENSVTVDIHCAGVGDWTTSRLSKEVCCRFCRVRVNPDDVLTAGMPAITSFTNYIGQYLMPQTLDQLMEPSDVVGNIRFSHPTLYVFPGGQGDAALFGINGFNMLVDGGFARKACFWDFTRHLDRLDAVLVTRINNSNIGGMFSVLRKKKEMHVYPQIGHFFCNLVERRQSNSPDGDKDIDPLILNLTDIGQEMVLNLRHINLRAHPCYRDSEPINLYHKVGHGTLDMYVLSPSKDSREVREFLSKWHASDSKLFAGSHKKDSNNLTFPIQNLVSICALLVWQPANPEDNITRILFPGSTPQHKIFEGFERLKHLDFLKHPVCSAKTLSPSTSLATLRDKPIKKLGLIEKESKKISEPKKEKREPSEPKSIKAADEAIPKTTPQSTPIIPTSKPKTEIKTKKVAENKKIEIEAKESKKIEKELKEVKKESKKEPIKVEKPEKREDETKKADLIKAESDKTASKEIKELKVKPEPKKKEVKESKTAIKTELKKSEVTPKPKPSERKAKPSGAEKKDSIKSSPTTPKKTLNGTATKAEISKAAPKAKLAPKIIPSLPAKSAKEANNRKVVEQKKSEVEKSVVKDTAVSVSKMSKPKPTDRKPISRRPKPVSPSKARMPGSPAKSTRSTPTTSVKSDKDGVIRKVKGDKGTTDSSTVSTPSGIEPEAVKPIDKSLIEQSEDMSLDSIESKVLADLKEEREVVEEIEAVLQKAERIEETRKDDRFEGDDEITAEATDKKEEDITEEDVTAEIEDMPKKEGSRKESQELTEEDEYLIVEKEEIYTEDSVQSGEGEQKHVLDEAESEKAKVLQDAEAIREKGEKEEPEEKGKDESPEKKVDKIADKDKEIAELFSEHKEQLQKEVKEIIASAAEIVQKAEEKDDSGKKDSEDITKEPSSLSPDKLDSSEKKTTDTDMKPDVDQKEHILEKREESQERISTIESGATTTAPTLPEDERIPLDEIKEDIDEKHVIEEVKEKDALIMWKEEIVPETVSATAKPEVKIFDVRQAMQNLQRDIVKTPDEVADLPVHEEVDPKLYRMEDFEKGKEEKPSPTTQEIKELPTPPVKEQKGVFSFFGKVADKFEKGIDKLTKKSKKESDKDSDEKSSKSSSPKELKIQEKTFFEEVDMEKMFRKVGKPADKPEMFEKMKPTVVDVKVAAIKETAAFIQEEIFDAQRKSVSDIEEKLPIDKMEEIKKTEAEIEEPLFAKDVSPKAVDDKEIAKEIELLKEEDIGEDVEEVKALLEEASKKFKTVKDSLRDSLESLEEKVKEEEIQHEVSSIKDIVKDTLEGVAEKLEEIKPHIESHSLDIKEPEKVKFAIPKDEEFEEEYEEELEGPYRDVKEAVRDVGEVLAGTAGINLEDKPKDVTEIVKKVAEVLKEDDFLSDKTLFDQASKKEEILPISEGKPSEEEISTEKKLSIPTEKISQEKDTKLEEIKSKLAHEDIVTPKKVGITEEFPVHEEVEELIEKPGKLLAPSEKPGAVEVKEEPCVKTIKMKDDTVTSPVKDITKDKKDAEKICAEMLKDDQHICDQHKKLPDDDTDRVDVMQAGIESTCVKETTKRPSLEDKLAESEIEHPVISFEQKVSPAKAEIVMVTPGSTPTSPKFTADKMYDKELEIDSRELSKLPEDIKQVLKKEAPIEEVIEELIITKKKKITIEVIEYITVVKRIPRERVIYIIEEIIVKKGLPRRSVVDDPEILKSKESITPEKRMEVEDYIVNEYIVKEKRITIEIVDEISIKKVVPKKIVIEIIEEIIVKRKIVRHMVLDIPEEVLSEIIKEESPEESPEESAEEQITSKIDITAKRESTAEVPSSPTKVEESIKPQKRTEIEEFVVNEYVGKGKKITASIIDEISTKKAVPKKILIEIIEEIIIKKKIPKNVLLDVAEEKSDLHEISTISRTTPEDKEEKKISETEVLDEKQKSIIEVPSVEIPEIKEPVTPQKKAEVEEYIIKEYVSKGDSINIQELEEICVKNKMPKKIIIEIIEEIIIKRKMPRHMVLGVTEEELSRIIKEEATPEPKVLHEKRESVDEVLSPDKKKKTPVELEKDKKKDMPEYEVGEKELSPASEKNVVEEEEEEEEEVDGFVSIRRKSFDEKKKATSPIKTEVLPAAKEHEKDVIDDFEAVEQEYKVRDVPITSPEKADEMREKEDIEETAEDTMSEVVEADEKFVQETKEKVEKEEPRIDVAKDIKSDDKKREPEEPETSEISEIVDTTEKYLDEAKEKTDDVSPKDKSLIEKAEELKELKEKEIPKDVSDKRPSIDVTAVPEVISKVIAPSTKLIDEKTATDKTKEIEPAKEKVEELITKDDKSKPTTPVKDETLTDIVSSEKLIEKVAEGIKPETKLADATGFAQEPKTELFKDNTKSKSLEPTEIKEISITKEEKSSPELSEETLHKRTSISKEPEDKVLEAKDEPHVEDVTKPLEEVKDEKYPADKPVKIDEDSGTVKRMLVTACSEDGREEIEICPTGSITFMKTVTPDDSLKDVSVKSTPEKESLLLDKDSLHSGVSTPEKDSISEKSVPESKDKVTPEDSLEKSPIGTHDSQDLEDSLEKSELHKPKDIKISSIDDSKPKTPEKSEDITKPKSPLQKEDLKMPDKIAAEKDTSQSEEGEKPKSPVKDAGEIEKVKPQAKEIVKKIEKPESPTKEKEKSPSPSEIIHEDVQKLPHDTTAEKSPVKSIEKPILPIEKAISQPEKEETTSISKTPESLRSEDVSPAETIFSKSPTDKHEMYFSKTPISEEDVASETVTEKLSELVKEIKPVVDKELKMSKERTPSPESKDRMSEKFETKEHDLKPTSPVITTSALDEKAPLEKSISPSSEKHEEKDVLSISSEKSDDKESAMRSKSPVSDKEEKEDATDKSKLSSIVSESVDKKISEEKETPKEREPVDTSKSPTIVSEKSEQDFKSPDKFPSVLSDKAEEKETDKSKSPSSIEKEIISEKSPILESEHDDEKGPIDEVRSSSAISDRSDERKEAERSKSPSIATDKPDLQDVEHSLEKQKSPIFDRSESPKDIDKTEEQDKSRSPSVASDKSDSKKVSSRSPSISVEKVDLKDMDLPIERARSSSVASDKEDKLEQLPTSKSFIDETELSKDAQKSPKLDETDLKDTIQPPLDKSRSSSVTSIGESKESILKEKSPIEELIDKSKSPSPIEQKLDIEEEESEKSRSSSIVKEYIPEEIKKLPGPVEEKLEDLIKEPIEKSRSPSVSSIVTDKKEPASRSKSPSIIDEKLDLKNVAEASHDKSRSPSIISVTEEQKEPIDLSKSPSIAGEKSDLKDVIDMPTDKSRSSSITSVTDTQKEPTDRLKSPNISGEKSDMKDVMETMTDKSRSSSVISIAEEKKEPFERLKSPSVTDEKPDLKDVVEQLDQFSSLTAISDVKKPEERSESSSIAGDKSDEKEPREDKSRSASVVSITSEQRETTDHSKSPSIAGEKPDLKDIAEQQIELPIDKSKSPSAMSDSKEPEEKLKSPSIAGDKLDEKESTADKSRSSSVVSTISEQKETTDRSKSPSIADEKLDLKDIAEQQSEKLPSDKSKSPSAMSDSREPEERLKSPSIAGDKLDEKESTADKSRSSSVVSTTSEQKETTDRSKSPSIADEKPDLKDIAEQQIEKLPSDKSRSPSAMSDSKEPEEKLKSPSIAGDKLDEKESTADKSRSSSIISTTSEQKETTDRSKSPSIADEKPDLKDIAEQQIEKLPSDKSRSPSAMSDSKEPEEKLKSPSIAGDKLDEKESTADKSRSPSVLSTTSEQKETTDRSKSPSIADEKPDLKDIAEQQIEKLPSDKSKSPSAMSDSREPEERLKSPSIAGDKLDEKESTADKSRSSSVVSTTSEQKEITDRSKSPSIAGEKPDLKDIEEQQIEKLPSDKSRSPSAMSDSKEPEEKLKSPSIAGDKLDEKESTADKSRSPSVLSTTSEQKETTDRSKSPSIADEKPDLKDIAEQQIEKLPSDKSRSPSAMSDSKEPEEKLKSPSIAGDKLDEKESTADKSRSPSVLSTTSEQKETTDRSKSPSIADEKPDLKDIAEQQIEKLPSDKSRSPSAMSDSKEFEEKLKSPSIAGDKLDEKESTADKSRSSSIISTTSEQKETTDRSKSPSIAGEKPDLKDIEDQQIEKLPSDKSRSPSAMSDSKEPEEKLKSPSIAGDKLDEKESTTDKSRSPSVVSTTSEQKETTDRSKSPSIAGEKPDLKDIAEQQIEKLPSDKSRPPSAMSDSKGPEEKLKSPSIAGDKLDEKESTADKSRSSSVVSTTSEQKETMDRSKSPSIAGEKPDLKDIAEQQIEKLPSDKSRSPSAMSDSKELEERLKSPSIAEDKLDEKELTAAKSRSASVVSATSEQKETTDRSKSPSLTGEKPDLKDVAEHQIEKLPSDKFDDKKSVDDSKSSSITGDKSDLTEVTEHLMDKSKSSSMASITSDQKEPIDKAKSISDKKEDFDRSISPSEKSEEVKSAVYSKPSSVVRDTADLKDVSESPVDKSRSPTVTTDQKEPIERPVSPQIIKEPHDRSKSPSIASEKSGSRRTSITEDKSDLKDVIEPPADKSKSSSIASLTTEKAEPFEKSISPTVSDKLESLVDRSKSPSIASDKSDEKMSDSKVGGKEYYEDASDKCPSFIDTKPLTIVEKLDIKSDDATPHDKSQFSSSDLDKQSVEKIDIDESKIFSGQVGQDVMEKMISSHIISGKTEPISLSDTSKLLDLVDNKFDQKEKSRSSSVTSERPGDIDTKISPSLDSEKVPKDESAKSSRASSPLDKTPKDRSRSQSVFDIDDKIPATRSSLIDDKLPEKVLPQDEKEAFKHIDIEKSLDEKDEDKNLPKEKKSPATSPEMIQKEMRKIREKRFADFEEPDITQSRTIEKSDDEEENIVKVTAEKKAEIEKYILEEYIVRKKKISLIVIEKLVMTYSVPQFIVMEIIEDIISRQNVPRNTVFDFVDDESDSQHKKEMTTLPPQEKADIEKYINEEFIAKKKKITPETLEEIVILKGLPRYVIITIIEEIIMTKHISRNTLIEGDLGELKEKSPDEKKDRPILPTDMKLKQTTVSQEYLHEKPSDTTKSESPDGKVSPADSARDVKALSASPSLSPEPIPSDKSTQDSPVRSEPHIDEEILISEEKRTEIVKLLEEEYIKKGRRITEVILEEIIIRTSLPRYIILEIVEEIILKKKIPRESVIDVEIYQEEEPEEDYDKAVYGYDKMADVSYELPHDAGKSSIEYRMSGMYSESGERQIDKSDYSMDYESQFHKAFSGGMTEMRTTHITTLSGKSTPEFIHDATPESGIAAADKAPEKLSESILTTTHITDVEDPKTVQTVTILRESKITEPHLPAESPEKHDAKHEIIDKDESEKETSKEDQSSDDIVIKKIVERKIIEQEETAETSGEPTIESDSDVIVVKKIIKREIVEPQEESESDKIETKETKRPSVQQDEPEAITKIIKREIVEHDEPEVITKVVEREIIEQDEPEIITKVIRREIIVPEEETSDSKEDSGEYVKTITTKTTRTIVTEELPDAELLQTDPSKIYTDPASGTTYRVVSDESAPDATSSADVKRIVTTVTTITGPDGKVTTKKDVKESSDTVDSEKLLEELIDSDKMTTETTKSAEKIIKETITTVTSGTSTPDAKIYDSGKSTPDLKQEDKLESTTKERLGVEKFEPSPLVKDLISDDKSYSGKSSPDISLPKDIVFSGSTGKSTPEIPMSPLIRDGAIQPHLSGRSTPDRKSDGRSSTGTPEGFRSGDVIRTTITTTKMISDEGEIVTTIREITEATNEKGETVVLAEKTDVKVDERMPSKDAAESAMSSIISGVKSSELQRSGSSASDDATSDKDRDPSSEHSSKIMTQAQRDSSEEPHTISDDEPPSSPLSSTSQMGYSPQATRRYEQSSDKEEEQKEHQIEFSAAAMSSSFYGELPAVPTQISAMKTFHGETGVQKSDPVPIHGHFMVEKEFAGGYGEKPDAKRYVDEADLDFDKALMEHKEMKEANGAFSSGIAPRYTNGSLRHEADDAKDHPSSSFHDDKEDAKGDSKKDPLEGWGIPLGLPSPKPPRKFNLKSSAQASCSSESTSDILNFDVLKDWGEPLRLPSPAPTTNEISNKGTPGTPKKERKQAKKVQSENIKNKKRSESPGKNEKKLKDSKNKIQPVYMDLAYVPHHGNSYYTSLEFFKRVRARYYVFSGTEPSREVYDALLEAKKTWEDKDLEITMIPTYDTDTLGYWVADNEEALAANHIDLSPSASRCTINLQDHETSCSAYRLEF